MERQGQHDGGELIATWIFFKNLIVRRKLNNIGGIKVVWYRTQVVDVYLGRGLFY